MSIFPEIKSIDLKPDYGHTKSENGPKVGTQGSGKETLERGKETSGNGGEYYMYLLISGLSTKLDEMCVHLQGKMCQRSS